MKKTKISPELVKMVNKALEMELAAYTQYLSHAEIVGGINAEPIIERLREIARYERLHQKTLRNLLGNYLGAVPSMKIAETYEADSNEKVLQVNLKVERDMVDHYSEIMAKLTEEKDNLPYEFQKIEFELNHIIRGHQSHISVLKLLLGQLGVK